MGYIPGFEHDIFISYSHVDNLTVFGEEKGWVERFHNDLQVCLSKHIGRIDRIKIWIDKRRLDGNLLFDEEIKEAVTKSAIFIALTSVGYLEESSYCKKELNLFHEKAIKESFGLNIGNRHRILNVLLNNISPEKWPEAYERTTGFKFNDAQNADEFGEPSIPATDTYRAQLLILTNALMKLIYSISGSEEVSSENKTKSEKEHFDVYLAEVADSLRTKKKQLKSKLIQQGITVSPDIPPPHEAREHESAVKNAIKKAHLSIHMLDEFSGAEIMGETNVTYPIKQVKLGFELAKSQFIWVPRPLDIKNIEDEQQRNFLTEIENNIGKEGSYDFLRGTTDDVYRVIMDKIEDLKNNQPSKNIAASVLLDIHAKDEPLVLEITKSLVEKNIIPYINPNVDIPADNIAMLKERLKLVNAVIIIYGKVAAQWVVSRLEEIVKIAMIEKAPVKSFCIYLAPPKKDSRLIESTYPFLHPRLIDNQGGFNAASFMPLYTDLGLTKASK